MNSGEELLDYLSGLHESTIVPDVLLIDDLHYYITQLKVKIFFLRSIFRLLLILAYYSFIKLDSSYPFTTSVEGHPRTYQVVKSSKRLKVDRLIWWREKKSAKYFNYHF